LAVRCLAGVAELARDWRTKPLCHTGAVRARNIDRVREGRAVVQVLSITTREADPDGYVQRWHDVGERLCLRDRRDRLDREQVGLGRRERLGTRSMELAKRDDRGAPIA